MDDCFSEPYNHLSKIDKRNIEIIKDPETTQKENKGSCYDQSFLVQKLLNELGFETKVFYSFTDNLKTYTWKENEIEHNLYYFHPGFISHMFVLSKINEKWKWIEWSWLANKDNTFDNENITEVLKNYQNTASKSWHHPMKIFEITDIKFPVLRLDILNKYANQQEINLNP